ncbi:exonuclease domain-containing protein [Streptomyces sp. NPDC007896]|uniref:3'-5' exonuclease n=1 Tax=Streptomyces sp. NPDC007896 TaxID=3364784 RepID=UPI0036EA4BD5
MRKTPPLDAVTDHRSQLSRACIGSWIRARELRTANGQEPAEEEQGQEAHRDDGRVPGVRRNGEGAPPRAAAGHDRARATAVRARAGPRHRPRRAAGRRLDTETTGRDREALIVDLGVQKVSGDVLVDTLLNSGEPIPVDATDLHGIFDDQVRDAPSLEDVLPQLTTALAGKRILIYNREFDVGRLRHELTLHYQRAGHDNPKASAAAWLDAVRFEDVMILLLDVVRGLVGLLGRVHLAALAGWQPLGARGLPSVT